MTAVSGIIQNSLNVLFGGGMADLWKQPRSLQIDILKRAYRSRMKKTHPDMAAVTGVDIEVLNRESQKLNEAYNTLINMVDGDRAQSRLNFYYHGEVPSRRFRFGEYLYYRGAISWRTLIDSLVWQYRMRPKFGEICLSLSYLGEKDIASVLLNKKTSEKFGETALRLGLLDAYRRNVVLGRQKSFDTPIGKYFTGQGLMTSGQVDVFLKDLQVHNLKQISSGIPARG